MNFFVLNSLLIVKERNVLNETMSTNSYQQNIDQGYEFNAYYGMLANIRDENPDLFFEFPEVVPVRFPMYGVIFLVLVKKCAGYDRRGRKLNHSNCSEFTDCSRCMDEDEWLDLCKERVKRIKASPSDEDEGFIKLFATMLPVGIDVSNPDFILDENIVMPFLTQKLCINMFYTDGEIFEMLEEDEIRTNNSMEEAERKAVQNIMDRFSDQTFPLIISYEQFTPRVREEEENTVCFI